MCHMIIYDVKKLHVYIDKSQYRINEVHERYLHEIEICIVIVTEK